MTLHARGRDIEEIETALQFERATCRWTVLGAASEVYVSNERAAVVKALEGAGPDGSSQKSWLPRAAAIVGLWIPCSSR